MMKYLLWLLTLVLFLHSEACRRRHLSKTALTRTPTDTTVISRKPADTTHAIINRPGIEEARTNVAEIDFTYLTARSKVSFKNKEQDINNANVNLRVKKDSIIWFSVSGLGIEVARGLVTRDTITIQDKVHREYVKYDFPTLSKQFNFNLDFDLLQALIVGNLPLPKKPAQKIKNERDYLLLRQSEGKVMVENYIGEQDRKLKKLMMVEQPTKNTLRLDYEDFTALNNFLFPYTSLLTVDYKSRSDGQFYQTLLRIQHNKVELVDKNPGFPFTIPPRYERRQ
ncbi:hypothetical protein GCM10023187_35930 [Nibrella viscosa]|uniref:DUF4292 domain-containing protein n=1 Tax=Nibrella viscosa TaxID=1084524 RepID=A0ABP8KNG8_9BACT